MITNEVSDGLAGGHRDRHDVGARVAPVAHRRLDLVRGALAPRRY